MQISSGNTNYLVRNQGPGYTGSLERFGAKRKPQKASPKKPRPTKSASNNPKSKTASKASSQQKTQPQTEPSKKSFWEKSLYALIGAFLIPAIPLTWTVTGVAGLTVGLPLLTKVVGPQFNEAGELINKREVLRNTVGLKRKFVKLIKFPLKPLSDSNAIKQKVSKSAQSAGKYITRKAFQLFKSNQMKSFITKVPKGRVGKLFYFAKWVAVLLLVALEKRIENKLSWIGKSIRWIVNLGMFRELKENAQRTFETMLPEDIQKSRQ